MAGYSNTYSGDLTTTIASKLYSAVKKRIDKNRDKADEEQDKLKESVKEAERAVDPKATKVTDKANRQYVAKVFGVGIDLKLMQMEAKAEKSLEQINEIKALTAHNTSLIIDHNEMLVNKLDALLGVFQEKLALDKKLADDAETARATGGGGGSGTKGYLKNLLNRPGNFIANFIKDLLLKRAKTALQRIVPRRLRARGRLLSRQLGRRVGPAARAMLRPRAAARTALTNYAKQGTKRLGIKLGAKGAAKAGLKTIGKKLPFGIGLGISAIFAAQRLFQKPPDPMGAALELASGAAAFVPGVGTAASLAIDAGLAARDMKRESETQQYATGTKNQYTRPGRAILHGTESVDLVDPKSGLPVKIIEDIGSQILSVSMATARAGKVADGIQSEASRLPFKIVNVPITADVKPRSIRASSAFALSRGLTESFSSSMFEDYMPEEEEEPDPNDPNAPPRQQNPLQRLFGGGGGNIQPQLVQRVGNQSQIWNKNLPATAITFDSAQGRDRSGEPGVDFSYNNIYKNYAMFDGSVVWVGTLNNGYGGSVIVRSTDPFDSSRQVDALYAHFAPGSQVVSKGQAVSAGDYLGPVGWIGPYDSGHAAPGAGSMGGPHTSLDFYEPDSIHVNSTYVPAKNYKKMQDYVIGRSNKTPVSNVTSAGPATPGYGGGGGIGGAYFKRGTGGDAKLKPNGPKITDRDYAALLAISALEDSDPQGRADVAQSIYNRLYSVLNYGTNFNQKGNTIFDIITANAHLGADGGGQYQPAFKNPQDWYNITGRQSAAYAMARAKGITVAKALTMLEETEKALKDPKLQALARKHVGGRTYFLGTSEQGNMDRSKGDVLRGPNDNFFSMWYQEGTKYDNDRRNISAPVPQRLAPAPPPPPPVKKQIRPSRPFSFWDFFGGGNQSSVQSQRLMASSADAEAIEEELNLLPVVLNKTVFVTKPSMNNGGMVATRQPTGYTRENYQMSRLAT